VHQGACMRGCAQALHHRHVFPYRFSDCLKHPSPRSPRLRLALRSERCRPNWERAVVRGQMMFVVFILCSSSCKQYFSLRHAGAAPPGSAVADAGVLGVRAGEVRALRPATGRECARRAAERSSVCVCVLSARTIAELRRAM